jgi:hypothetical protein
MAVWSISRRVPCSRRLVRENLHGRGRAIVHPPLRARAAPRGGPGSAPPGGAGDRACVVHSGGVDAEAETATDAGVRPVSR